MLDVLGRKKIRGALRGDTFPLCSALVAGTAAVMNIAAVGTVIVAAMTAAKMVDRLAGEGVVGEARSGNDDLSVLVPVPGVCGLKTWHFYRETAYFRNQSASSSSLREPSARCRKVR